MAIRLDGRTMRDLRTLFDGGTMGSWTDGQLVAEFLTGREGSEPALRVLMERHGPMVLTVCRRILGDDDAAEDAFQATFLVLVRKAGSLRGRGALSNWIYGVALRVARKERTRTVRRRVVERRAGAGLPDRPDEGPELMELRSVIDEEIARLPERYRAPVVLCYLEGLRHEDVAQRLGCPVGTVESRLSRARERLRARLTRRGLAPSASLLGPVLKPLDGSNAMSLSAIIGRTVAAAVDLPSRGLSPMSAMARWSGGWVLSLGPAARAGVALSITVVCAAVVAAGFLGSGSQDELPRPDAIGVESAPVVEPPATQDEPKPANPKNKPRLADRPVFQGDVPLQDDVAISQTREALKPTRESFAYAPPLSAITIDGQLDDWPAAMPRYPIDKLLDPDPNGHFGHGGLRGANLRTNPDLSAAFSVGYDPEEQLIYLAVIVRDDKLVLGHSSHLDTDAIEVYVDGRHTERQIPFPDSDEAFYALDPAGVPVMQYVGIPGKGMIYGRRQASNPILIHGEAKKTRTRMAYSRKGDVTTYEWAIQVFDRYPDMPTRLELGVRIGFDVAINDKDVPATSPGGLNDPRADRAAWIYWGPQWRGIKVLDAGALGELILVK
jgi:RNA polymerase sigma factor (sigma-70 family)